MKVERALISLSDKTGLEELAKGLKELGIEIISTGGTAETIQKAGVPVKKVEEVTGFPEILDGRVKTLHPKIHGGILARRKKKKDRETLRNLGIETIDMVVVNLYPFSETVLEETSREEILENIDIGGPTLIRAAAKNYRNVAVVTDKADYSRILDELKATGEIGQKTRKELATKAFEHATFYDSVIGGYFRSQNGGEAGFPEELALGWKKKMETRYGENPHQRGAFYINLLEKGPSVASAEKLQGKDLSFNNINDSNSAIGLIKEFDRPAAAVFKHTNPCGTAVDDSISEAFKRALECDPKSAFGGIIALNRECDRKTAVEITSFFNEVVIAPSYREEALQQLKSKRKLRVLRVEGLDSAGPERGLDIKNVESGVLLQERDSYTPKKSDLETVTERKPAESQLKDMEFGWKVAKHTKSNAVILVKNEATVGIGAGQMSRVDAVKLAVEEAGEKAEGSVMVSDAFFPFRDSIDEASKVGVRAVIQPGGSIRDEEVIEAANEHKMAMVFTGHRCFRH